MQMTKKREKFMFQALEINLKMTQFSLLLVAFHQFGMLECDHEG